MRFIGLSRAVLHLGFAVAVTLHPGAVGAGDADPDRPAHHRERGFLNTDAGDSRPAGWTRAKFFLSRIWATTVQPRAVDLPRVPNDGRALRENRAHPTVTWVGHSTLLIQLDGVNLLTDPHWSDRASPVSFMGPRRLTPLGLRFEDLPPIHLVLISHDHYDQLDQTTVTRLARAHRPQFFVPLGLKDWFADLGIGRVEELDWWESRVVQGLTVTCLPAQHFSGRTLWDRNRRLWSGWAVAGREKRFFFAGDTAYYAVFKEIGDRVGPFDLAAIPIGAYMPREIMRRSHITPEEAVQLFNDVRGHRFVGVHWGTFEMSEEPIDEPPKRVRAEARRRGIDQDRIWILKHGETRRW